MKRKRCTKCCKRKLANTHNFHKHKNKKDGLQGWCVECKKTYGKGYRQTNRNKILKRQAKYRYKNKEMLGWKAICYLYHLGKDWKEAKQLWERMLKRQHNRCAVCGRKFNKKNQACCDHNHKTRKVRGLLCHRCNLIIGCCYEDIGLLIKMTEYLRG